VKLVSFDAAKKISVIKEVKTLLNLGLKESKELVDAVPSVLMKDIAADEAAKIQAKLIAAGAKIDLE
jgi:large subunit ribosomal protein L7/L12